MTRINLFRTKATRNSTSIVDSKEPAKDFGKNISIAVFAGILIACSLAVGCSSEKPKPASADQTPVAQTAPPSPMNSPVAPAASQAQASAKPVHKKVVHRAPATLTYADKDSGVSFHYPRKYVLKTGDDANELVSSSLVPMDFSQPGGLVTAAVAIPEGAYPKSDLVSALFDVSVNKSLTAGQCEEFSINRADSATPAITSAPTDESATSNSSTPIAPAAAPTAPVPAPPKLIIGDMELTSAEMVGRVESRKEASKYYHVFENGACYEFSLKVTTTGAEPDEGGKAVDRDEIFKRLETILATVKINPVEPEKTASSPVAAPAIPAQ
jgi:hypothetical protein